MHKHYKYVHILWADELKFNIQVFKLFHDDNNFNSNEHFFITTSKNVYKLLSKYDDVEFYETSKYKPAKLVNYVGKFAEGIIMHSVCRPFELVKIRPKYLKHTVLRYWGGNTLQGYNYNKSNGACKNFIFFVVNYLFKKQVHKFKGIGVSSCVDEIELNLIYKNLNYYYLNYPSKEYYEILNKALTNQTKKEEKKYYNVLVGHSGYSYDKHVPIVNSFERFKDKPIKLYLMLSYGDEGYIKSVKNYFANNDFSNVMIIDEFMELEQYCEFLLNMDAAVLPSYFSSSLGNVFLLLRFNKKIFLDENGPIAKAFEQCSIPFSSYEEIKNMTYNELIEPINYSEESINEIGASNYDICVNRWKTVLSLF